MRGRSTKSGLQVKYLFLIYNYTVTMRKNKIYLNLSTKIETYFVESLIKKPTFFPKKYVCCQKF